MRTRTEIEQRLLAQCGSGRWGPAAVLPDYEGYSIVGLPSLIGRLFDLDGRDTALAELVPDLSGHDHVILLLLDGLGYRKVEALFDRMPDLLIRSFGRDGLFLPLTSVFPSTTVAALASIGTGMTPLEHGLVGYRLYLRETSTITNMIRFAMVGNGRTDAAFSAGLDPDAVVRGPTAQERLAGHGVNVHTLLPQHIASSGLSRALYKGSAQLHAAVGLSDMLVIARELLLRATAPTFLSLYWPGLDTVAHVRGPETDAYVAELRSIDDAIRRELVGQAGNTLLLLSADHGFVPMAANDYQHVHDIPPIDQALLLPPVGEPRASYLFVRDGERETVSAALTHHLRDGLVCADSPTLVEDGLLGYGPPHPETHRRIGDLTVVSTGKAGIVHPYQDAVRLLGMHGGLTEEEMLVPLIATSL